jgi:hypothetical protein
LVAVDTTQEVSTMVVVAAVVLVVWITMIGQPLVIPKERLSIVVATIVVAQVVEMLSKIAEGSLTIAIRNNNY